jgi:hypothetical protein
MAFNLNDIISNFKNGGARPNLFQCFITNKANPVADFQLPFVCEASSIPGKVHGNIRIPYFGRVHNEAGEPEYSPWTVTIMNDEEFNIRNAMEEWHSAINHPERNSRSLTNYHSQGTVLQYGKDQSILRTYKFHNIYPQSISDIRLGWADNNSYEKFDVTFMYDYWTVDGATGDAGTS